MHKKFIVPVDGIVNFLGLLDPGESCIIITYRAHPNNDYLVELDKGTNWDPEFDCLHAPGVEAVV